MTELNQFASIYERKSVDNSNTSNSSVANPLSDNNVDVIIELFTDNSSGVTKKENLVKSYFGNNADTAIEIFSNKSSDSSSSSEEVSLKSYFGADTATLTAKQKRIMSYSPYDLVKYSKEDIDEVVNAMRAHAKKEGIDFDKLSTEEKMRFTGLALALKTGRITEAEFVALVSDSVSDDVKAKIQNYIKDHTSEIDEEKLGKIRSVMSSAARKEAFLNFVAAKNIRGRNPEDTKTRQERFLLMAAERTEETQQKLMEKVASALPSTCTEDVARKVIESTSHYSQEKMSSMLRLSKSFNGSDSFQKALADMATTVAKKAKSLTTLFLDGFRIPWTSKFLPFALSTICKYYFTFPEDKSFGVRNKRTRKSLVKITASKDIGMDNYPLNCVDQLLKLSKIVRRNLNKVKCPILCIHSKYDNLASTKGAKIVMEGISSPLKKYVELKKSYHMVLYDNEKGFVMSEVYNFLSTLTDTKDRETLLV